MAVKRLVDIPEAPITSTTTLINKTGSWKNVKPVLREKTAPCVVSCPANIDIPRVINYVLSRNLLQAVKTIYNSNPFPSITGRVCPRLCEGKCNRKQYDYPINIRDIEKYVGDAFLDKKDEIIEVARDNGRTISIVGSGPAGLSASFYLRRLGYRVVVYEREDEIGGLLRYGIPPHRLEREVLDKEISFLKRIGVEFRTKVEVCKDVSMEKLREESVAVLICTGTPIAKELNIEGEDCFISGIEFLKDINKGKIKEVKGKVAVIGGGNTAIDVAISVKSLGGDVVVIYRRTEDKMRAIREEVENAMNIGVEFIFLETPIRARKEGDRYILETACVEISGDELKVRDDCVRRYEFDILVKAIGERRDVSILPEGVSDISIAINGKLFTAGDFLKGPSTVIEAFATGRDASFMIHNLLERGDLGRIDKPRDEDAVWIDSIVLDYFKRERRINVRSEADLMHEAGRCFSCGVCNSCGNCWIFCPDVAIRMDENQKPEFLYDYCKGCGICKTECPRGVIELE